MIAAGAVNEWVKNKEARILDVAAGTGFVGEQVIPLLEHLGNKMVRGARDVRPLSVQCFITARKRSLGQGNMFTGVCLSTGGVPGPGGAWSRGGAW